MVNVVVEEVPPPSNLPNIIGDLQLWSLNMNNSGKLAGVLASVNGKDNYYYGYWINENGATEFIQPLSLQDSSFVWPMRMLNNRDGLIGGWWKRGAARFFRYDIAAKTLTEIQNLPPGFSQSNLVAIRDDGSIIGDFDLKDDVYTQYVFGDRPARKIVIPGYTQIISAWISVGDLFSVHQAVAEGESPRVTPWHSVLIRNNQVIDLGRISVCDVNDSGDIVFLNSNVPPPLPNTFSCNVRLNGQNIALPYPLFPDKAAAGQWAKITNEGSVIGVYRIISSFQKQEFEDGLFLWERGQLTDLMTSPPLSRFRLRNTLLTQVNAQGQFAFSAEILSDKQKRRHCFRCRIWQ